MNTVAARIAQRQIRVGELSTRNLTVSEIAEILEVSDSSVRKDMEALGIAPPRKQARCGTDSGYASHRKRGEPACGPCRAAHSDAQLQRARNRQLPRVPAAVRVPRSLVAVLYLNAPIEVQELAEREMGRERLDAIVAHYDGGAA